MIDWIASKVFSCFSSLIWLEKGGKVLKNYKIINYAQDQPNNFPFLTCCLILSTNMRFHGKIIRYIFLRNLVKILILIIVNIESSLSWLLLSKFYRKNIENFIFLSWQIKIQVKKWRCDHEFQNSIASNGIAIRNDTISRGSCLSPNPRSSDVVMIEVSPKVVLSTLSLPPIPRLFDFQVGSVHIGDVEAVGELCKFGGGAKGRLA